MVAIACNKCSSLKGDGSARSDVLHLSGRPWRCTLLNRAGFPIDLHSSRASTHYRVTLSTQSYVVILSHKWRYFKLTTLPVNGTSHIGS